ncbi:hypothetical protein [Marinimicrobium locisalis]|uniref:hypothetical protein n=1 Tax=Marinimicrobium locisalis TaxID=546022 RepID=UPI0032219551
MLSFRAPRHKPSQRVVSPVSRSPYTDALSQGLHVKEGHWRLKVIFKRNWAFWGPWMTGDKGELSMAVAVVARHEEHEYPNTSFFHPRVFESALVDYLNTTYGDQQLDEPGFPKHQGPVDWKAENHLPVFSGRCVVYRTMRYAKPFDPEHLVLFPITQKHFVHITFFHSIYSDDRSGPLFDTTPITELQEAIINTIQLDLGPEAQAEWNRVAAECPDMSLTEHFAPLKWPIDLDNQKSVVESEPERLTKPV